ncbi:MAG TPA: hypothetical protein VGJ21_12035 [Terracidiphilus sp.]|jgi:hypothetical protein
MGREAICTCNWAGTVAQVKALIEPPELILRGELRRRVPLSEMKQVRADGDRLRFSFRDDDISITLGNATAARWAKAITAPPPSLAKKLGITAGSTVRLIGEADDGALEDALSVAKLVSKDKGDLILARVDTAADLARALKSSADDLARGVPIWFVYPKGRGHAVDENTVRSTALSTGIVDTKVAAVSSRLTALRFVKRRA